MDRHQLFVVVHLNFNKKKIHFIESFINRFRLKTIELVYISSQFKICSLLCSFEPQKKTFATIFARKDSYSWYDERNCSFKQWKTIKHPFSIFLKALTRLCCVFTFCSDSFDIWSGTKITRQNKTIVFRSSVH